MTHSCLSYYHRNLVTWALSWVLLGSLYLAWIFLLVTVRLQMPFLSLWVNLVQCLHITIKPSCWGWGWRKMSVKCCPPCVLTVVSLGVLLWATLFLPTMNAILTPIPTDSLLAQVKPISLHLEIWSSPYCWPLLLNLPFPLVLRSHFRSIFWGRWSRLSAYYEKSPKLCHLGEWDAAHPPSLLGRAGPSSLGLLPPLQSILPV